MQISFLSFSIFAGFWSLDDKEVITLFGHYIFFHYSIRNGAVNACFFHCSIRNGAEALSLYLNHLRNLSKYRKRIE